MSVIAWKWLLQTIDDTLLTNIAKAMQIRIPGFRDDHWDKSIKLLRPRIIQTMLQPQQLLDLQQAASARLEPEVLALREQGEPQLLEQVPGQFAPAQVLLALLSSSEESIAAKGETLFASWQESGLLSQEQAVANEGEHGDAAAERIDAYIQQVTALEAKLRRREKKLQKLTTELAQTKTSVTRAKKHWQEERKQLVRQLTERDATIEDCERQLAEQAQLIAQLQEQIAQAAIAGCEGTVDVVQQDQAAESPALATIAVVGNLPQINLSAACDIGYKLTHIAPNELQTEQTLSLLQSVDQVWLLTYATPLPLQRRLREIVPSEILSCFHNYREYIRNLGQGV